MSKETKFTKEELIKIEEIKTRYDAITVQLGQLRVEELMLKQSSDLLTKEMYTIQDNEKVLADALSKKYGKGQLNLDTGVFVSDN